MDIQSEADASAAQSHISALKLPAICEPVGEDNPAREAVWIVFGASGHLGRSLTKAALSHGDKVAAVGWSQEDSITDLPAWQDANSTSMLCDVRIRHTVDETIKKSIDLWGRVDVIANCTGYGVIGACEDQDEFELRNQFETNFMGTLNIIQLSLPHFRAQNHGRYLIFSSTAGALGVPGLGPFCATKYAVEGLIESLLYEVDCFNIKATLVEPGHMRLEESERIALGLKRYAHFQVKNASEPYANNNAPAGHAKRIIQWLKDKQPVSTARSAELVWQLAHCSYPPLRLLLGGYAVDSIRDRLRSVIEEIEDWKHLHFPTKLVDDGSTGDTNMKNALTEEDEDGS